MSYKTKEIIAAIFFGIVLIATINLIYVIIT